MLSIILSKSDALTTHSFPGTLYNLCKLSIRFIRVSTLVLHKSINLSKMQQHYWLVVFVVMAISNTCQSVRTSCTDSWFWASGTSCQSNCDSAESQSSSSHSFVEAAVTLPQEMMTIQQQPQSSHNLSLLLWLVICSGAAVGIWGRKVFACIVESPLTPCITAALYAAAIFWGTSFVVFPNRNNTIRQESMSNAVVCLNAADPPTNQCCYPVGQIVVATCCYGSPSPCCCLNEHCLVNGFKGYCCAQNEAFKPDGSCRGVCGDQCCGFW